MTSRLALLLVGCAACAGLGTGDALDPIPTSTSADAGANAELSVELGTGVTAYVPLSDGAPVDVVFGPQGGFHIWTSVRVHDASLDLARIDLSSRLSDDGHPAGNPSSLTTPLVAIDGAREHAGMTCFVADPATVRGRRVILHVDVRSQDGRRGSAERVVVPR